MVCFGEMWYYLPSESVRELKLGEWQHFQVAGPALRRNPGCHRTTRVTDADGFTIEQPQSGTVILSKPFTVRSLMGQVVYGSNLPLDSATVEFLKIGAKTVFRATTDSHGGFKLPPEPDGEYKFKVTKNGF